MISPILAGLIIMAIGVTFVETGSAEGPSTGRVGTDIYGGFCVIFGYFLLVAGAT